MAKKYNPLARIGLDYYTYTETERSINMGAFDPQFLDDVNYDSAGGFVIDYSNRIYTFGESDGFGNMIIRRFTPEGLEDETFTPLTHSDATGRLLVLPNNKVLILSHNGIDGFSFSIIINTYGSNHISQSLYNASDTQEYNMCHNYGYASDTSDSELVLVYSNEVAMFDLSGTKINSYQATYPIRCIDRVGDYLFISESQYGNSNTVISKIDLNTFQKDTTWGDINCGCNVGTIKAKNSGTVYISGSNVPGYVSEVDRYGVSSNLEVPNLLEQSYRRIFTYSMPYIYGLVLVAPTCVNITNGSIKWDDLPWTDNTIYQFWIAMFDDNSLLIRLNNSHYKYKFEDNNYVNDNIRNTTETQMLLSELNNNVHKLIEMI